MDFDEFVRARAPGLLRFACAMTGDPGLAEDVLQEVLIRVHHRWKHIGALDVPEAYVRRAVVNEYLSWRRKWSRLVPRAEVRVSDEAGVDHAEQLAHRSDLASRLGGLPERQRTVLVLRYLEDMADADIADLLGCRASSVRSNASRGLATLRADSRKEEQDHHAH